MMPKSKIFLAVLLTSGLASHASVAAEPFYTGKLITFVVGQSAGGSADLSCRLIAQFMGKHIAGNPTIIVKNMPSPDGLNGYNFVGRSAKNDGLTAICGPSAAGDQLLHNPALSVDLTKFTYISGDGSPGVIYARTDVAPGLKSATDIFKAEGLVIGGFSALSLNDVVFRTLLSTIGIDNYKYVTGFPGSANARAAMQEKFINLYQENITGYLQVTYPSMVKTGEVIPLYQFGQPDGKGSLSLRDGRLPDLPTFVEFYEAKFGKPPSGSTWELGKLIAENFDIGRDVLALPPAAPPEAASALRAAVDPLNNDPDFIAASDKLRGKGTRERPASEVTANLNEFLGMPPDLLQQYNNFVKSGNDIAQKK